MYPHLWLTVITTIVCLLATSPTSAQWTSTSVRTVQIQSLANPSQYLVVPFGTSGNLGLNTNGGVFTIAPLQPGSQSNEVTIIHESTGLYLQARRQFSGPPLPPGQFIPASALLGTDHFQLSATLTGLSLDDQYSGVWSETRARSADGSLVVDTFYQEIFYLPAPVGAPRHTRAYLGYSGKMEPISSGTPPPQWHSECQPESCGALNPDWCICCESPAPTCVNGGILNPDCSCSCPTACANGGTLNPDCSCSCPTACANGGTLNPDCSCSCPTACANGGTLNPDCSCSCPTACAHGGTLNPDCSCSCFMICANDATWTPNCLCNCTEACPYDGIPNPDTCACSCRPCAHSGCLPDPEDCSCCDLDAPEHFGTPWCLGTSSNGANPVGWPPGNWGYSSNGRYNGGGFVNATMRMLSAATSSFDQCDGWSAPETWLADSFYFYARGINSDVSCTVNINWNGDSRFYSTTVPAHFDGVISTGADGFMPQRYGPWMAWTIDCDAAVLPSWTADPNACTFTLPSPIYMCGGNPSPGPICSWKAYDGSAFCYLHYPWVAVTTPGRACSSFLDSNCIRT